MSKYVMSEQDLQELQEAQMDEFVSIHKALVRAKLLPIESVFSLRFGISAAVEACGLSIETFLIQARVLDPEQYRRGRPATDTFPTPVFVDTPLRPEHFPLDINDIEL